ncbi:unnamed protein product [Phytophthora fragariaefolia]|uniref:Unnamed protein product n=1 Tax=Phytophthora fragariaefolia TaxID=1490495 RepID=A0A9W6WXN5_9STRA|nr:unnamed protein product [Phytophthora fragariaefolia]
MDAAQRVVGTPHHALHAVHRADKVGKVDTLTATGPNEDVLVKVGHAHDFVRHNLADRKHQIVATFPQLAETKEQTVTTSHTPSYEQAKPLTSLLICAGHGSFTLPSLASRMSSAGTWPIVTTSFLHKAPLKLVIANTTSDEPTHLQSCTRKISLGMSPNIYNSIAPNTSASSPHPSP